MTIEQLDKDQIDTLLSLIENRLYLLENRDANEFDYNYSDHEEILDLNKIKDTINKIVPEHYTNTIFKLEKRISNLLLQNQKLKLELKWG